MDSGCNMQDIGPDNSQRQTKNSHDDSNVVGKPAKSDFSFVESGKEVHATGLSKFLLWKDLFVCRCLR